MNCFSNVHLKMRNQAYNLPLHVEKVLATEHGPLGKDALPQFKSWRNTGTAIERAVRITSDTFGPAEDYLGLRDRWEAYCADKGDYFNLNGLLI